MMGRRLLFISKWPPRLNQRGLQNATATHASNASASAHSGVVASSLMATTTRATIATMTANAKFKLTKAAGAVACAGSIGTSVAATATATATAAAAAAHPLAISSRNISSILRRTDSCSSISIKSRIAAGGGRQRGMATTGAAARVPRIGGLHDVRDTTHIA